MTSLVPAHPAPFRSNAPSVKVASEGTDSRSIGAVAAQVGVVLAGIDFYLAMGANLVLIFVIVLLPVLIPVLRRYSMSRAIVLTTLAALLWGYVLAVQTSLDHTVIVKNMHIFIGVVLTGTAAMTVVLWARLHVPIGRVAVLYGFGGLIKAAMHHEFTWKFGLSVPVTFIVLGLLSRVQSRFVQAAGTIALGVFGIATGARSYFAFCFISAMMFLWQGIMSSARSGADQLSTFRRWLPAILMAGVGMVVYFGASALLTAGFFGQFLQQRSISQIETSGSLIAGGRPEWAATRQLMRMRPHGFGMGVVPSWEDLRSGKAGLASINVDAGGYTRYYMFGGSFELHSVTSDLWVNCGIVGLAMAGLAIFTLARNITSLLASRQAEIIVLFSTNLALWSMLFGPLYTDWISICVALGLSMLVSQTKHGERSPASFT